MRALAIAVALALSATAAAAQDGLSTGVVQSQVVTVDRDRLFSDSAFGRRIVQEIEARSQALAAENRRIESELIAEERELTERRKTMKADAFRPLAQAFDEKVQRLRSEQDAKVRAVTRLSEEAQQLFFQQVGDVLRQVVRDRGAVALLDRRVVLLSAEAIDITDQAIARIDEEIGEGTELLPETLPPPSVETPPQTDGEGGVIERPAEPELLGPAAPRE